MTPLRRYPATLAVCLLLSVLVAACGSSSSGGNGGGSTPAGTSTADTAGAPTVTIQGFAFHPSSLTVKSGTKVTFIQEDSGVQHNATATGANAFNTPSMSKGQKFTVTFSEAGTYNYICTIHPNMHGTIIVT